MGGLPLSMLEKVDISDLEQMQTKSHLAMEKRKMGLVSLLPAVYLHTRSSGSRDSPPEISSTWERL